MAEPEGLVDKPLHHDRTCVEVEVEVQSGDSPDCQWVARRVSGEIAQHHGFAEIAALPATQVSAVARNDNQRDCINKPKCPGQPDQYGSKRVDRTR